MHFNSETDNPKLKLDEAGNVQDGIFFFFFLILCQGVGKGRLVRLVINCHDGPSFLSGFSTSIY